MSYSSLNNTTSTMEHTKMTNISTDDPHSPNGDQDFICVFLFVIVLIASTFLSIYAACSVWISKGDIDMPTLLRARTYNILGVYAIRLENIFSDEDEIFTIDSRCVDERKRDCL